jgi:hypothetical protein
VPPPDPAEGVDPVEEPPELLEPFLFLLAGDDGVVTPPESGVVVGWNVWGGFVDPPPPDAMAITTTRRNRTTPPTATSLRRRYTASLSRAACTGDRP